MSNWFKKAGEAIGASIILFALIMLWVVGYSGCYQKITGKSDPDYKMGRRISLVMFIMFVITTYTAVLELIPGLTMELLEHNIWAQIGLGSMMLYIPLLGLKFNRQ
jgi:hypothetical protein